MGFFDKIFKPNVSALAKRADVDSLIHCLAHSDWKTRSDAAIALGEIGAASAARPLIALLEDQSVPVIDAAILSLGRIGAGEALVPLARVCNRNPNLLLQHDAEAAMNLIFSQNPGASRDMLDPETLRRMHDNPKSQQR